MNRLFRYFSYIIIGVTVSTVSYYIGVYNEAKNNSLNLVKQYTEGYRTGFIKGYRRYQKDTLEIINGRKSGYDNI